MRRWNAKQKPKPETDKSKAWRAMSRYIRLRDALAYCLTHDIDLGQFTRPEDILCECVTCGVVKSWIRLQGGHCIPRGLGGRSGVYFNEKNLGAQCAPCNAWEQGRRKEFEAAIIEQHGQEVMDELIRLDKTNRYDSFEYLGIKMMAEQNYKQLVEGI